MIIGLALRLWANGFFLDIYSLSIKIPQIVLPFFKIISRGYVIKSFFYCICCLDRVFFVVIITAITRSVTANMTCFGFGLFACFGLILVIFEKRSSYCILTRLFSMLHLFHRNLINSILSWLLPHILRVSKLLIN